MSRFHSSRIAFVGICICMMTTDTRARQVQLGSIDFPNSGSPAAQADFIEGTLFLHNFEYEQAANAYQRAQELDPSFALAYWGEAMTYNHPVWMQQDQSAAVDALNRLAPDPKSRALLAKTDVEKDLLNAVEILYGTVPESADFSKEQRDDLYAATMLQLQGKYTGNDEIATFHALSILGTAHEGRDFSTYMRAAATAIQVWENNRDHPGAAHYVIHSFDDPVHAPLGLPMARAYSVIAPNAAHAQHMTSHIFVALGLWDDVVSANIVASRVQNDRNESLGRRENVCGHYTSWLQYGYLQTGQNVTALEMMTACYERMTDSPTNGEKGYFARMRARYVIDSEDWQAARQFSLESAEIPSVTARSSYEFTSAFAALRLGNTTAAKKFAGERIDADSRSDHDEIYVHQLLGLLAADEGDISAAEKHLKAAVEHETSLPFEFGPPPFVKPTYELLGEFYLETGMPNKAESAFSEQLKRTRLRASSMRGVEIAAENSGTR